MANQNTLVLDITPEYFGWPKFYRSERNHLVSDSNSITLIYPSAYYSHKNHHLLNQISFDETANVEVTISDSELNDASDSVIFL